MSRRDPFKRADAPRRPLHLNHTEQATLEAVSQFGPVSSDQLRQIVWPRPSQKTYAESVLRRLFDAGYLGRIAFIDGTGPPRVLYVLGPMGRRAEAQRRQLSASTIAPRPAKQRSYKPMFLAHHLATVQVVINFRLAAARLHGTLTQYTRDRQLRRDRNDSVARLPVIPDAFVALNVAGRTQGFFIELDRATKTVASWRDRFGDYWLFRKAEAYQNDFMSPAILTVVDAAAPRAGSRLRALKQALEATAEGRDTTLFWFAKLSEATADAILTKPIWQIGGLEGSYSLLPPGKESLLP
jgi:hypothetical protein